MRQELRRALRARIRARRVTVTAVALFAIAAGGTTAVFAVVDAVLLRPLPYRDAGQLVQVRTWDNLDHLIGRKTGYLGARTGENADNLRSMTAVFEAVGGYGLLEQEESVERNGVSERGMRLRAHADLSTAIHAALMRERFAKIVGEARVSSVNAPLEGVSVIAESEWAHGSPTIPAAARRNPRRRSGRRWSAPSGCAVRA